MQFPSQQPITINTMGKLSKAKAEMPKYRCHKEVWALKIKRVVQNPDGSVDMFFEEPFAPLNLDIAYSEKHNPQAGGYYVVYQDGYKSFSPSEAFESGYTRI